MIDIDNVYIRQKYSLQELLVMFQNLPVTNRNVPEFTHQINLNLFGTISCIRKLQNLF